MFNPYKRAGSLSPGGEPMALGSPASSPHSPQKNYLPPFLFGDVPNSHPSSSTTPGHLTPVGNWNSPQPKHSVSFSTPHMSPIMARKQLYQSPAIQNSTSLMNSPSIRKPGAPPVESLFGAIPGQERTPDILKMDSSRHMPMPLRNLNETSFSDYHQTSSVLTPSISLNNTANNTSNFVSPAQIDPFYTQGEALSLNSELDESWITVFGFPPAATTYILQQFSQYGKIIENKLATSGNWIHLRYQSKLQAKKALSKNGRIFGGNIMVGVKPCIEMNLMNNSGKENSAVADASANFCQDIRENESDSEKKSWTNIRPLTQIYKVPSGDMENLHRSVSQSKSSSLVSKAFEYFKW